MENANEKHVISCDVMIGAIGVGLARWEEESWKEGYCRTKVVAQGDLPSPESLFEIGYLELQFSVD